MKKATLIIWLIIFGFIALVIFQNQAFFMEKHSLRLNLGVTNEYHTPEMPIAVVFVLFFLAGIIIAYLFNFSVRFRARRTAKKLHAAIATHKGEVSELQRELNTLKGSGTSETGPAAETVTDTETVIELPSDSMIANPDNQSDTSSADSEKKSEQK